MKRLRLAAPVMLVYWLMLVGGMALFTFNRMEDAAALQGIWLALLIGTVVGHALAVVNLRTAAAFISILLAGCWFVAIFPPDVTGSAFARTFVAAGLCAFWSLGDRSSLAAFWFPTMIWMLSILDRTGANAMPDRIGIVLLGGLAIAFVLFLRTREARRIEMWRTVGFTALATPRPATMLKEHPGGRLARASWSLFVASIAFGVTAWLAPQLWHIEGITGDPVTIRFPDSGGLPCCPVAYTQATHRTRVKEYLDLGRGHDEPGLLVRPSCGMTQSSMSIAHRSAAASAASAAARPTATCRRSRAAAVVPSRSSRTSMATRRTPAPPARSAIPVARWRARHPRPRASPRRCPDSPRPSSRCRASHRHRCRRRRTPHRP